MVGFLESVVFFRLPPKIKQFTTNQMAADLNYRLPTSFDKKLIHLYLMNKEKKGISRHDTIDISICTNYTQLYTCMIPQ